MNERYVVVLLTDDGTGKMDGSSQSYDASDAVVYHILNHVELFYPEWELDQKIGAMQPMDLLFFGDSNRCAYVHRTQ